MADYKPKILCVDDATSVLMSLKRLFAREPWDVAVAEGGEDALKVLDEGPVALIISDQRMPQLEGVELLTKVREQWPDTVRIHLTGYADIEAAKGAVNDGQVYRFLSKPWDPNELKQIVRQGPRSLESEDTESRTV